MMENHKDNQLTNNAKQQQEYQLNRSQNNVTETSFKLRVDIFEVMSCSFEAMSRVRTSSRYEQQDIQI